MSGGAVRQNWGVTGGIIFLFFMWGGAVRRNWGVTGATPRDILSQKKINK